MLADSEFINGMFGRINETTFDLNEAQVGGGIYLKMRDRVESGVFEPHNKHMVVMNSIFTRNAASVEGGALYTDTPSALDVCCSCNLEET
eukprot:evm.model.scf_266.1 EVM.evm.TU.scf_266.1   scf_266:7280-8165(-)